MALHDSAGALEIVPLTPDRWDDVAALFGEGGDPRTCWCASFRVRRRAKGMPPAANRAVLAEAAERDPTPGLIAYRAGRVVSWVSLGPREDFVKLPGWHQEAPSQALRVASQTNCRSRLTSSSGGA